ncbi:MAG TPA: hypothetical protein VGB95_04365, partial [Chitinophagales bacterium]
ADISTSSTTKTEVQQELIAEPIVEETIFETVENTMEEDTASVYETPKTEKKKDSKWWGKMVKGLDNWLKDPNVHDDFEE